MNRQGSNKLGQTQDATDTELELTFLAKYLPKELTEANVKRITDVYVPEEAEHARLRIRQNGHDYEITKKTPVEVGDASKHNEATIRLDKAEFRALALSSKKTVVKDRYTLKIDDRKVEFDIFKEGLEGLVLIDFEFSNEEEMRSFVRPDFCLADVTQETFIAGGMLAGKDIAHIKPKLNSFGYKFLFI